MLNIKITDKLYYFCVFCLILFLSACTRDIPSERTVVIPSTEQESEVEVVSPISPLAVVTAGINEPNTPLEIPTPEPATGVVYGKVGQPSPAGRIWELSGAYIYLAPLIHSKDDTGKSIVPIVRLDAENDSHVDLMPEQYFVFANVAPGEYAFVLTNPIESYVVPGDHDSGFMIIEVSAGEITDIGVLPLP